MLWRAASAYTQHEFHAVMEEIKGINAKAHEYLAIHGSPSTGTIPY
jgi:hypothetical protein